MATPEPDQNCIFGCWGNDGRLPGYICFGGIEPVTRDIEASIVKDIG
jgi:hypothetical protein